MRPLFALVLLVSSSAVAQSEMFTAQEIREHRDRVDVITKTASECLSATYQDHLQFFNKWGVSKYYGNRKAEHKTEEGRRQALKKYGAPESLISELKPISCIGLTMKCLAEGFEAAGTGATWRKIHQRLAVGKKFYGTDLQKMLHELGWQAYYWNPDPSKNAAWDAEDRALNPLAPGKVWNPVWGGHAYRYTLVRKSSSYADVPIDDIETLVNFKETPPAALQQVPFFVGVAHAGYHVFPGKFGDVIEAHSTRNLNSIDNLQVSQFNPLAPSGGPRWTRSEKYRSGVIVLPPSR